MRQAYFSRISYQPWISSHKIASIFSSAVDAAIPDSLSLKRFDNGHQVVLNANGEVLVGDTIVWYATDGIKHFVPNADENQLAKIKSGEIQSAITDTYSISRLTPTEVKDDKSQTHTIWNNPGNGAHTIARPEQVPYFGILIVNVMRR
ncbi:hypothetical protein [Chryseolinea soli]|uniref:Uncharacterized protein n=1 Tax=Chryseolinea soli TaxID=2321403 RepID=A0A385SL15_9BACT|nr:hypothetical protein [Chryseolinea soli]AYB31929.1 hypothetical protein D4L85_15755 [Chryseolinea soli]